MTRCFTAWAIVLLGVAIFGHVTGTLWLTFAPFFLPLIYADQYLASHYPEEDPCR